MMFKIASVPYLNGMPLIEGLEGVVLRPPSRLGALLTSGKADAVLVSAIEVLRHGWSYVPGIAVASPGKTDSVRLHHRVALSRVRRVALDRNSRSSNALARILLERRYGLRPTYVTRDPSRKLSLQGLDAALTIGDSSFRREGWPYLDLGTEWRKFTGLPFVYALWAYLPDHPRARELGAVLRRAKALGLKRLDEIAAREAKRLGRTARFCLRYLTKYITYDLGPSEREGLDLFEKYARALTPPAL
ncbi:MAG TPA: menaquinone biosynthesis protein [Planctomycetota bacterium]|nr:menaquinone biosynthesis protein [Planctomycetota bacterium]